MASTSYIGVLESDLLEPPASSSTTAGQVDFSTVFGGSKTLHASAANGWKWQNGETDVEAARAAVCKTRNAHKCFMLIESQADQELALFTLVFPDTLTNSALPPPESSVPVLHDRRVGALPVSKNILSPISQDEMLVFSVPLDMAPEFARSIQKLPITRTGQASTTQDDDVGEEKWWLMAASRGEAAGNNRTFARKVADAWSAFVDLLKVSLIRPLYGTSSNGATESRRDRHRYHGPRLSFHAPYIRVTLCLPSSTWLQLLVGDIRSPELSICLSFRHFSHTPIWRASQRSATLRGIAFPRCSDWFRETDYPYQGSSVSIACA